MKLKIKYKARNKNQKIIKGVVMVENIDEFKQLISNAKLQLISYREEKERKFLFEYHLSNLEIVNFSKKLKLLIASKMPLDDALEAVYKTTSNKYLKKAIVEMIKDIKKGNTFSSSLASNHGLFPTFFIAMIKLSEKSGDLYGTLSYLENYYEVQFKTKQKLKSALTYPIILSIFTLIILALLIFVIIPKFKEIYQSMDIERIPKITKIIFNISDFIINNYLFIFGGLVFIYIFIKLLLINGNKDLHDYLKIKFPFTSKLNMTIIYANFTRCLWMLYKKRLNVMDSLKLIKDVINNNYFNKKIDNIITNIETGMSLSSALIASRFFPSMITELTIIGESSNSVEDVTLTLANYYEEEMKNKITGMTQLIEPIIIFFVAFVVSIIVLAVFLPMFGVMDQIAEV